MPATRTAVGDVAGRYPLSLLCLLLLLGCVGDRGAVPSRSNALDPGPRAIHLEAGTHARLREAYGKLPMSFEANQGQADEQVKFLSRGNGYSVFLTSTEAVFAFRDPASQKAGKDARINHVNGDVEAVESSSAMRMTLVGANQPRQMKGLESLPGMTSYFRGSDASMWRTDIPTYGRVQYENVYPGIDLIYHGSQRQLEYDFVVAPGANPNVIRLSFQGVDDVRIDATGDLVVQLAHKEIRQHRPVIYQEGDAGRHEILGGYVLEGHREIGFMLDVYDTTRPLVIDPTLVYSTYLGGSGVDFLHGTGSIAVDAAGSAYVTGTTSSADFPTTAGAFQPTYAGGNFNCSSDAFVSKLDPTGSVLVYSTYLGGDACDSSRGIAVDASGNAYVTGHTDSGDFPVTPGALQRPCSYLSCTGQGFITKLNTTGTGLLYSASLRGIGLAGVVVDRFGNAFVAGSEQRCCDSNVFVAKVNAAGSALAYDTQFGGANESDWAYGIAIDEFGSAYVTGGTNSPDFPTTPGAFQRTCPQREGNRGCFIAFISKIDPLGSFLAYSTYLGGYTSAQGPGSSSQGFAIAVDAFGQAYVAGIAFSTDFPTTPGAFQTTFGGDGDDAFVTKLNTTGTGLVYSTYLGGGAEDGAYGLAIDHTGNAYVTGFTGSLDFPTVNAFQPALAGSEDVFIAKLNTEGAGLIYASYLGGSSLDQGFGIAVDSAGSAYVTGITVSTDFPLRHPSQAVYGGSSDAIVAKISELSCGANVTDQVDVFRSAFYRIFFTRFRFQWVVIHNKTAVPIAGPLAFVMDDLKNAVFIGSPSKTSCFSPEGDPFMVVPVGSDNVLSPNESRLTGLWFFKTRSGPITYTPHVLSGIPTE